MSVLWTVASIFSLSIAVIVCVYLCMVHVSLHVGAHGYRGQESVLVSSLIILYLVFGGRLSNWTQSLLVWLVCWSASSRELSLSPWYWDYRCVLPHPAFPYRCWGSELRPSICLHNRHVTGWAISRSQVLPLWGLILCGPYASDVLFFFC